MTDTNIYRDIAARTDGAFMLGVVGPVRTGKSTFIKRFMETLVIPRIDNTYMKERARDELPQSGSGRTIMTAEPKFIPEEAVTIRLGEDTDLSVRLIDCVGYMVKGASGQFEDGVERMVTTPWFDKEISLTEAAEQGTYKVIAEHSTIGLVVTCDGTICEIPREDYVPAEERVIRELQEIGEPFTVVLNSAEPNAESAKALCRSIREKYGTGCVCVNCLELSENDISEILKSALCEFPLSELDVFLPSWVDALPIEHPLRTSLYNGVRASAQSIHRIRDVYPMADTLRAEENILSVSVAALQMGRGIADIRVDLPRALYYQTISEQSGFAIRDDGDLMALLTEMRGIKNEYDRISSALKDVRETGYGIVVPSPDELKLEEPEIVRQGGRYGVRMRASAPSIHLIRADIETTVSPIVGNEKQSEDMVNYLLQEFEGDTGKLWQSNIFGRSFHEIVGEDLQAKLKRMPADAQAKLRQALERIINEGGGGLICIIL